MISGNIYMQNSDRRLASNRRPIIKSMSHTSVSQIYVNRFSNSQIRVQLSNNEYMVVSHFLKSTSNYVTGVCPNQ
jgi:hypothetical protein